MDGLVRVALVVGEPGPGLVDALGAAGLAVDVIARPTGGKVAAGLRPCWWWTDGAGVPVADDDLDRLAGHVAAWRRAAAADGPTLVVDGDARPGPSLGDALVDLPAPDDAGWDVVLLARWPAGDPWDADVDPAALAVVTPRAAATLVARSGDAAVPVDHLVAQSGLAVDTCDPAVAVAPARGRRRPATAHLVVVDGTAPAALAAAGDDGVVAWLPAGRARLDGSAAELLEAWAARGGAVVVAPGGGGAPGPGLVGAAASLRALAADPHVASARAGGDEGALLAALVAAGAVVDDEGEVFHLGGDRVALVGGRMVDVATGARPPVAVGPAAASGPGDGADVGVAALLGYVDAVAPDAGARGPEVVAPEIVRLPFWTPGFCRFVVAAALAADAWSSDPDDPVPGREISLGVLSPRLAAHVERHVGTLVVPALREVWPELAWHGLQDAFVLVDVPGPDAGLALHHDVAQVSASVRLTDGYEGGALEFPRQGWTNAGLPVGDLVAWPSLVTHPHRGAPVTRGWKASLTLWFRLPVHAAPAT